VDRLLERADSDGDGALSAAELEEMADGRRQARMERMFERVDADGDGSLTEAELDAAMARMSERRGGGHGGAHGGGHGEGRGHGFWRG
jgi:Ca2+-binding EF-hand superfamily protein